MLVRTSRFAVAALAMGAVLSFTSLARAQTTYYVNGSCGDDSWTGLSPVCEAPNGPKATIQAGINAAAHFDKVEVADGIYRGVGNKNLEFFTKEMSIRSSGGPEMCIIDCENDGFGFTFCTLPDDRPVTIEGFTIRNGRGVGVGGICIDRAEVTILDCVIENCVGRGDGGSFRSAGGIWIADSQVALVRTVIRANTAGLEDSVTAAGGGISVNGETYLDIEDCRIEDNRAISEHARGGGLFINSVSTTSLRMARTIVARNVAESTAGFAEGGGAYIDQILQSPIQITECDFLDNEVVSRNSLAAVGGGLKVGAQLVMSDCTIARNRALDGGGLVLASSRHSMRILDSTIIENHASLFGGGILVSVGTDNIRFLRTRISGNVAEIDGGGYFASRGDGADLICCEFTGNVAGGHGGALAAEMGTINRCSIVGNRAGGDGGGIYAGRDDQARGLTLHNSVLARNEAQARGGAVFTYRPDVRFGSVTIANNQSGSGGGGLHIEAPSQGAQYSLENSIVRGNSPASIVDLSGTFEVNRSNVKDGWPGIGNIDANPRFVDPLNDNFRLSAGSPCIDAGDNRFVLSEADLAGEPRRVDDAGIPDAGVASAPIVDMGAYEFQGTSTGFIAVHPRPGVAGRDNQLQVAGATPGNVVYFVYGFATGSTGVPGCPGVNVEIANPRMAAQATADGGGYASSIVAIPGAAAGRAIVLQAVDRGACNASNVVSYRFP